VVAEALFRRALTVFDKACGVESYGSQCVHMNMARTFINLGDYKQAEKLARKVLKWRGESLATNHPDLGYVKQLLGDVYSAKQEFKRAETMYQMAFLELSDALGIDHPASQYALSRLNELVALRE